MKCRNADWDVDPHCSLCKGIGWLYPIKRSISTPEGDLDIPDYSRVIRCANPGCSDDILHGRNLKERIASVSQEKREQTLENFNAVPGSRNTFKATKQFAEQTGTFIFLLIIGDVGCGKTHLANATALKLAQAGRNVKIRNVAELIGELKDSFADNSVEAKIRAYQEIEVLILDDYKADRTSNWGDNEIERIIDYRYQIMKPTMLTTNNSLGEIPPRLQSRFADKKCSMSIWNEAKDYRKVRS